MTARRLEIASAVLLSLAAVATAWAAYQSRQWTGQQALATSRATAARIGQNRAAALANRQVQIDVATFIQWLDARAGRRTELADFYRQRFRAEFRPAFDRWLATRPFTDRAAPPTPFALRDYRLGASAQADALERRAAGESDTSKAANERANNYMLGVVLFSTALFFAGISTKLDSPRLRGVLLALGWLIIVVALGWIATFPVRV